MDPLTLIILALLVPLSILAIVFGMRRGRAVAVVLGWVSLALLLVGLFAGFTAALNFLAYAMVLGFVLSIVAFILSLTGRDRRRVSQVAAPPLPQPVLLYGRTNGLAIASFIVVFFSSLIGLILGHVALSQIKRTGESGRGLALAAVIIGWIATGLAVVFVVIALVAGFAHH